MQIDASQLRGLAADLTGVSKTAGQAARAVVRKTALDVERTAKGLVPVDTGNLRASIGHSDLRAMGTSGSIEAEIGPSANYGIYVEEGTSRMGPQPYMQPALDRVAPAFEAAMGKVADL